LTGKIITAFAPLISTKILHSSRSPVSIANSITITTVAVIVHRCAVVLIDGDVALLRRAAVVILIVIDSKTVVLLYGSMILARRATIVFSIGICSGAQIPVDRSGAQCLREKVRVVIAVPVRMAAALIHWRRLLVSKVTVITLLILTARLS
jgi:hypothetical protein